MAVMCFSCLAYSEVATATDETAEAVVLGKIVQQQHPQNANPIPDLANSRQPTSSTQQAPIETPVQQPQIANDMAEGESIRALPTLNQPVVDQANLLTAAEKQQISQRILNLHQQAKAQIGVVIVPTTGQEDIFDFAMRVAEQWQLGSAKQDNGVLMAIAVNDRRIQILTGYGLEGVLPDIVVSRIINQRITPYFKQAQYAQGIDAGLAEIERILNLDPEVAAQAAQELKQRQEQALQEQQAREKTLSSCFIYFNCRGNWLTDCRKTLKCFNRCRGRYSGRFGQWCRLNHQFNDWRGNFLFTHHCHCTDHFPNFLVLCRAWWRTWRWRFWWWRRL